jgi:hypothetical protein
MNKEKQLIAIAEACGWKPLFISRDLNGNPFPGQDVPPDYLNDLNAMAEAEKVKEMAFDSDYAYWLARIAVRDRGLNEDRLNVGDGFQIALTATASQRAEAFLRTIEKWEDK